MSLSPPDNGHLSTLEAVYNTEVEVWCEEGYRLEPGDSTQHILPQIRCLEGGVWSGNLSQCAGM